jgi:dihydroneopterin aldolase
MKTVVGLKKVNFYAKHGYYEQEKSTGNHFEITLKCFFKAKNGLFINYENLYEMVNNIMKAESIDYIETINELIIDAVIKQYSFVEKIKIATIKTTAPISGFNGKGTLVKMTWKK